MKPCRRCLVGLGLGVLVTARARAAAPPPPGRRRLGVLLFDREQIWAFLKPDLRQALAELGWVEGANLTTDWRFADGDAARLPALAAALAGSGVDAIMTRGTPATHALQRATRTVAIVTGVGDPIGSGFAETLARPGGNITSISWAEAESAQKKLELLRELVPGLARLTIVIKADRRPFLAEMSGAIEAAARAATITTRVALVASAGELGQELLRMPGKSLHAAFVFGLGADIAPTEVAGALPLARVPSVFEYRLDVDAGGQMSYRLDWDDQTRRTGAQIDKVFRGETPQQIPFELPTRTEFVLNARTAKALGLAIPHALRVRADEVIQ